MYMYMYAMPYVHVHCTCTGTFAAAKAIEKYLNEANKPAMTAVSEEGDGGGSTSEPVLADSDLATAAAAIVTTSNGLAQQALTQKVTSGSFRIFS